TNTGMGGVGGTFSGLVEGAFLTNNGVVFKLTYRGGDGNDVALIQQTVVAPNITGLSLLNGGVQGVVINGSRVPLATDNVRTTSSRPPPVQWVTTDVAFADANGLIQYVDSNPVTWFGQLFYRFVTP